VSTTINGAPFVAVGDDTPAVAPVAALAADAAAVTAAAAAAAAAAVAAEEGVAVEEEAGAPKEPPLPGPTRPGRRNAVGTGVAPDDHVE
jgi:hypothetical protein